MKGVPPAGGLEVAVGVAVQAVVQAGIVSADVYAFDAAASGPLAAILCSYKGGSRDLRDQIVVYAL